VKKRPSFVDIALATAKVWSLRSEDPYRKVGSCILNKEGRVLSAGYNGLPSKVSVDDKFWENREERRRYMIHAEINALSLIKRSDEPYILACTLLPCSSCATSIISYGIKHVVYLEDYNLDKNALDIFRFYGVQLQKYEKD
jgi:dCMP deaminase